jgi:mannose/cellobiose epimerase-like protein (N-acyl-D-glucosamine 2-epimerase family)
MKKSILLVTLLYFVLTFCSVAATNPQNQSDLEKIKRDLEKILTENIIPFWYPAVIDKEYGGYLLNHDVDGKWIGPSDKYLVTQARMVWFFSRLARSKYGTQEHLQAAEHGYKFLRDKMWDKDFGGFYWAVNSTGSEATISYKHLYGQSFGLYALSEYAIASGDPDAKQFTRRLFNILEFLAYDQTYGGYRESFMRNWCSTEKDDKGPMGSGPDMKLMNTHLHLMEAMTTYYEATKDPVARERLIELITIQSNSVVRKNMGVCTDKFQRDWTPINGIEYDRVSYGHDIENIWLLMEACDVAGINSRPLTDLFHALFSYSYKYGYDQKNGGFYDSGPFNIEADQRQKVWWVQAECMVSALYMYYLTEDNFYFDCFTKTLDWIMKNQVDWENGDWFASISGSGKASGLKSGAWKSAYHNGRAVITCIELIDNALNTLTRE